jgi:hypothetical protein
VLAGGCDLTQGGGDVGEARDPRRVRRGRRLARRLDRRRADQHPFGRRHADAVVGQPLPRQRFLDVGGQGDDGIELAAFKRAQQRRARARLQGYADAGVVRQRILQALRESGGLERAFDAHAKRAIGTPGLRECRQGHGRCGREDRAAGQPKGIDARSGCRKFGVVERHGPGLYTRLFLVRG